MCGPWFLKFQTLTWVSDKRDNADPNTIEPTEIGRIRERRNGERWNKIGEK